MLALVSLFFDIFLTLCALRRPGVASFHLSTSRPGGSTPFATPSLQHRSAPQPSFFPATSTFGLYSNKMGQTMSWVSNLIWAKKEIRILILGLVRASPSPLRFRLRY